MRGARVDRPSVVALVTDAIFPYHVGGKEMRYWHVASGLVARGFEVHVFTMHWWRGPRKRVDGGIHYHAICRRYQMYSGTRRSILEAVLFAVACLSLLRRSFQYDLIEADQMPHLQLFTLWLVARLRRVPLVVTWHEFWGREYWSHYLGGLGRIAAAVEQVTLRVGDHLVTPSPGTRDRLVAHGVAPARVSIVPNGLDLEAIASAEPNADAVDVLFVGRLIEHKHVDILLESLARLKDLRGRVTCAIVGDGPEREALQKLVLGLNLAGQVQFVGSVEAQADVLGRMKSASLLVLPSTREGYGIVVAEALACGLPVVTTDHPDNHARALVEPGVTGWLCEPTADALAATITEALEARLAKPLVRQEALAELSWDGTVSRIEEVFATVLASRVGAPHA